jgi:urea ABC transporter ATP-binding protein UrtE
MLKLHEVVSGYGSSLVLHGITHEVHAGEVSVVLGRNGVGKTTLLSTIAGRIGVRRGTIAVDGAEVTRLRAHQRAGRGIAYVPQGREIFAGLTVEENLKIAIIGSTEREWKRLRDESLDQFPDLRPKLNARGGSLSGGQQQILAIARALIGDPKVLLLDEPSEGIQPSIVADIADIIASAARERGIAVLVAEQNLDFVARVAAEVHVIDKGQLIRTIDLTELRADEGLQHELLGV